MRQQSTEWGEVCHRCGIEIDPDGGYYDFGEDALCTDCMVDYVVEHYYRG